MTKKMKIKGKEYPDGHTEFDLPIPLPEELQLNNILLKSRITNLNSKLDSLNSKAERLFEKQNEVQNRRLAALNLAKKRLHRTLSGGRT